MNILAIIPARPGSERIPQKNIQNFGVMLMIFWSIAAAQESKFLTNRRVYRFRRNRCNSTNIRRNNSIHTPERIIRRYDSYCSCLFYAVNWFMQKGTFPKFVYCIYPTASLIQVVHLARGFELLQKTNAPSTVSVTTFAFPILRPFKILPDGTASYNWPKHELSRSQDLPEFYPDAGQFYWLRASKLIAKNG